MANYEGRWTTVRVEVEEGIGWVTLNRPEKRNAMSPTLNREMREVLETLELDGEVKVLVLTGAGESWTAGMDLKEYFREVDQAPEIVQEKIRRDASTWQWKLLRMYAKPTIAMVNGWCFGGGFSPLVACDLAIASETAVFGLSEINWGIPPGNLVSKALADTVGQRKALEYIMTGETFTGTQAAEMGLVNRAVPLEQASRRDDCAGAQAGGKESGRAARGQARLQAMPRTHLGAERGLPLRQARSGATARSGARSRKGTEAVPGRKEHQAGVWKVIGADRGSRRQDLDRFARSARLPSADFDRLLAAALYRADRGICDSRFTGRMCSRQSGEMPDTQGSCTW